MNLRDSILEEHSRAQAVRIADYVGDDREKFDELLKLMLSPVYRVSQRAAWPVSLCIERHPEMVKPYFGVLIDQLEREDAHVAVRRNVVRMMQFVAIPKRYAGRIFDACYNLVDDPDQPIAVKAFAMTVAADIAKGSPELRAELQLVVRKYLPGASAGYRSRAKRVLDVS